MEEIEVTEIKITTTSDNNKHVRKYSRIGVRYKRITNGRNVIRNPRIKTATTIRRV